jgi:hypothetical protein
MVDTTMGRRLWHPWGKVSDATMHPKMHRPDSNNKEISSPKVNIAKTKKPWSKSEFCKHFLGRTR